MDCVPSPHPNSSSHNIKKLPSFRTFQAMASLALLFSILCIQFMLLHYPISYASPLCHPHESSALLHFKSSFAIYNSSYDYYQCLGNDYRAKTRTWKNGTDCCSWDGITCNTVSGHVIGLDLSCSMLRGNFHPNSSLFFLVHLRKLNLAFNNFSQSLIPFGISRLDSLTHLNLSNSEFSGELPSEISNLFKLVSLDLSNWNVHIEASTWKQLIQNVTDLKELVLNEVNMSSITPNYFSSLVNLSSSLVTLRLQGAELEGKFASQILCLPKLQELDLSSNHYLQGQLSKSNCSSSLDILDLSYCSLEGSIVILSNFTQLTFLNLCANNFNSQIPSSLSNLQHLTHLDLSENNFSNQIPSSLSNLQHLTHLDLSENNFSNQIPNEFGRLSKLEYLLLNTNSLRGRLPFSLFDLPQLEVLDCSSNKLEGPFPNKVIGHSNLQLLYLGGNRFNGTIPSWISFPFLRDLDLRNNQFIGLTDMFLNLVNLSGLMLSSNNISGFVEFCHFSKLQNLEYLDISNNSFLSINLNSSVNYSFPRLEELDMSSCNITTLPNFFGQLPQLQHLHLSSTNLNGKVPKWLFELPQLQLLDLSSNNLTGEVPKCIFEERNYSLEYLDLSQNLFTSVEPFSFSNVIFLDLSFNMLSGEILPLICRASNLEILILSDNKLTGSIPQCIETLSNLSILHLEMNKLSGLLPNYLNLNALRDLILNGNQFEGPLPQSLAECKELSVLNLGSNMINDTFPHWLAPLPQLRILILRSNKFQGIIENFKTSHPFPKLTIFDISNNRFSGPLPREYIANFDAMRNATKETKELYMAEVGEHYGYGFLSIGLTMKGTYMSMERVLNALTTIDLSQNMFEGEIPKIIGELHGLIALNLSHNRLEGPIPQSMGGMSDLESLDLSSNMLTGSIPTELTNLNFLSDLNVSQNKLVGSIPQGKQFDTFSNDSYWGNLGLCGLPLTKKCIKDPQEQPPSSQTSHRGQLLGFGWQPVALGYGCGMVFGVILGWCMFKTGKPQWIVRIVEGEPNQRMRRTRRRSAR